MAGATAPRRSSRQAIIVGLILIAGSVPVVIHGPALWRAIVISRDYYETTTEGERVVGWSEYHLFREAPVKTALFHVSTGFQCMQSSTVDGETRQTRWDSRGRVQEQWRSGLRFRNQPPWWWGVTDQGAPTAPWHAEGTSAEEWLERKND